MRSSDPRFVHEEFDVREPRSGQAQKPEAPRRKIILDEDRPVRRINMISEAHFGPSRSNPTFLMWLKDMDAPRFSGKIEDFMDWKIALNQFMELMSPAQGGLSNAMKLEILNRALDPTNRIILQAHRDNGGP